MTSPALTPMSVRISQETATVLCEACGGKLAVATNDRDRMVLDVRTFLDTHGACIRA